MESKNIILVTHKDFDGCVAGMVVQAALDKRIKQSMAITYQDKIEKMQLVFRLMKEKDYNLILTDVALDENRDDIWLPTLRQLENRVLWIDHHESSKDVQLKNKIWEIGKSASKITLEYFSSKPKYRERVVHLEQLVKYANDYDLWIQEYKMSYALSDLFSYYWSKKFAQRFRSGVIKLNDEEKRYIKKIVKFRKEKWEDIKENGLYLSQHEVGKYYIITDIPKQGGYELINYLSDKLKNDNPDNCDFVLMLIGMDKVSIRSLKDDYNLLEHLGRYGAGGHRMAAGTIINLEDEEDEFVRNFLRGKINT